jgi:NTP pyrophosphatase (non-canonical NTP hydrolase)
MVCLNREQAANWFASQMLVKLELNKWKGNWESISFSNLLALLKKEVDELEHAIGHEGYDCIILEAADVGNFAMMIADNADIKLAQQLESMCEPKESAQSEPPNVAFHRYLLDVLHGGYVRKNHDYGNSFHETFQKFGLVAPVVRMSDKLSRVVTLLTKDPKIADETISDTLLDLANYAIMTAMELDREVNYGCNRCDETH